MAPIAFASLDESSVAEKTPVSITLPSLSTDPALSEAALDAYVHVAEPPASGRMQQIPLPILLDPHPIIAPAPDLEFDEAPPSSRSPVSVAPPMPQIPKPISVRSPIYQAPGIVSTQPIPLVPSRRSRGRSPIFVALAFALIGGMIALAVLLAVKPKGPPKGAAVASSAEAALVVTPPNAAPNNTGAAITSAPSAAITGAPSAATSAPAASQAAKTAPMEPSGAAASGARSAPKPGAQPPAGSHQTHKSDRIED